MLVPMTSDKGLCGGINSGIVRHLKAMIGHDHGSYTIFCIGNKGETALLRPFPSIFKYSISRLGLLNWNLASSIGYQITQAASDE